MLTLNEKPTAVFDVDETLVTWAPAGPFAAPVYIGSMVVYRHEAHIQRLMHHHLIGHNVVVWSHGGSEWATKVVTALGLDHVVDVVMPKGSWFYDDKPGEIITEYTHRYIRPGSPT